MGEADVTETTLRVRYAETDAMGVVYHTNYIVWFGVGRGDFLRQKGGNYKHVEDEGIYLPVTEVDAMQVGDLVRRWFAVFLVDDYTDESWQWVCELQEDGAAQCWRANQAYRDNLKHRMEKRKVKRG